MVIMSQTFDESGWVVDRDRIGRLLQRAGPCEELGISIQVLEHASAMYYMGLIDLKQRAEAEARAASVAAHINNGAGPAARCGLCTFACLRVVRPSGGCQPQGPPYPCPDAVRPCSEVKHDPFLLLAQTPSPEPIIHLPHRQPDGCAARAAGTAGPPTNARGVRRKARQGQSPAATSLQSDG